MNTTVTNNNDRTKEKKEKKKEVNRINDITVRYSGGSLEVAALSPLQSSFPGTGTIQKEQSILGLEIPASIRRDRKSTRLNSSHSGESRMPSSA